ncbi:MAG: M14 family zinc carboxypeptidase, partial [Syntrophomonadaceae bacterium]|nr:M14 family zinc carboxypeptidase [Syntrophomonadaceae bacterium]
MNLLERTLAAIPDYRTFFTVDELDLSTRRLAAEYPGLVELTTAGLSRDGHPILQLRIGSGRRRALLFGCPHPNEPIGAMMLEYLSRRLCEDPDLLRELDYTWYIIKCVDVDGTRLNEGWFKGPFTPLHYAMHFYRPAMHQQMEWTFP